MDKFKHLFEAKKTKLSIGNFEFLKDYSNHLQMIGKLDGEFVKFAFNTQDANNGSAIPMHVQDPDDEDRWIPEKTISGKDADKLLKIKDSM